MSERWIPSDSSSYQRCSERANRPSLARQRQISDWATACISSQDMRAPISVGWCSPTRQTWPTRQRALPHPSILAGSPKATSMRAPWMKARTRWPIPAGISSSCAGGAKRQRPTSPTTSRRRLHMSRGRNRCRTTPRADFAILRTVTGDVGPGRYASGVTTQSNSPRALGLWTPESCVAYIDRELLATRWGGMILEQIGAQASPLAMSSWVWCEPRSIAINRFEAWANSFLREAERVIRDWDPHLADAQFATATAEIDHAGFCIAAISEAPIPLLRRAAVLLASTYWMAGKFEEEALWRDISFDFEPDEIRRIKSEVIYKGATLQSRASSPWTVRSEGRRVEQPCI